MQIETAGQSGANGQSDAKLTGIVDIHAVQSAIIAKRDALVDNRSSESATGVESSHDASASIGLLTEIRDALHRAEKRASL